MNFYKNDIEIKLITLQQFSSGNDILKFEFKKPLNFELQGSLVEIIYELDKLDNLKNNNINLDETEETIVITWLVKESITLTPGDKKVQIVIKNNDRVYLSSVFIIKVLESLHIDNQIVESNLSYLEYWEERIKELAKKVEEFEGLDLDNFVTDEELTENYFNKSQIEEKLNFKVDKTELENLATKEELSIKADLNDVYNKTETYNKNEINHLIENIDISNQLQNLATKEELENKLDKNTYETDKEQFAIKEDIYTKQQIDEKISEITSIDVSNFATKEELNTKADKNNTYTKQEVDEKVLNASTPNIIAGNGINLKNTTISAKVDNKTISFDKQGNLQANVTVGGGEDGNIQLKQVIIDDVKSGLKYEIFNENINQKSLVQVFKIESSKLEKENILAFNIEDSDVLSEKGIKIKNLFSLNVSDGESEIVNKSLFSEILKMQGGV